MTESNNVHRHFSDHNIKSIKEVLGFIEKEYDNNFLTIEQHAEFNMEMFQVISKLFQIYDMLRENGNE